MKIGLHSWGTSGDIRPFLALAGGLKDAGHEVTLAFQCAEKKDYSPLAEAMGIRYRQATVSAAVDIARINGEMTRTLNSYKQVRSYYEYSFYPYLEDMYASAMRLCGENDLVIGHAANPTLLSAAEKCGCPRALVGLYPQIVASEHDPPEGLPNLGRSLNRVAWSLLGHALTRLLYAPLNGVRARNGLPSIKCVFREAYTPEDTLVLMAVDPRLCPPQPDWDDNVRNVRVCGFFNMPPGRAPWRMPGEMRDFIDAGDPPVFMSFGTFTPATHRQDNVRLFLEAARLSGSRAIIQVDPDMPHAASLSGRSDIYALTGGAPHHEIFPHCSLIVHHGGSGTSHSSLYAGRPSVVVAHVGDQPYWAEQLRLLGVAGRGLHRRSLTAKKLARAIRQVAFSPKIIEKARQVGERMRRESGVQKAVELLEERFG